MRDGFAARLGGTLATAALLLAAGAAPAEAGDRGAKAPVVPVAAAAKPSPVEWKATLDEALLAARPAKGERRPVFLLRVIGRREGCT